MDASSFLASFYFVCGAIIFFLAVTILHHSVRSIVNWSTALVLIFAGFGPILGALSVFLRQNLREGTYIFESLVGSFNYTWEFFFPSLVLFAFVHPRHHRLWRYARRFLWILFLPHLFHLVMVMFLLERVNPARMFNFLLDLHIAAGAAPTLFGGIVNSLNDMMILLFKVHVQFFSLVNIMYATFSLILLGRSLKSDLAPRVRRQMHLVVGGLGLCITTYVLARFIPYFAGAYAGGGSEDLAIGFINASLIFGGGSIAYAVVRYQFLDIRLIARKGIFYGAAVAILASIYLLVVKHITGFIEQYAGTNVEILEMVMIIVFIILFQPVLGRLEDWIERILVRAEGRPSVRIRDLSGELLAMVEVESMKERLKETLTEAFAVEEVDLVMREEIVTGREQDIYAKRVIEVLEHVGEPIIRIDFLEAMGFLNVRDRTLFRPGRKVIEEAVLTLPVVVRRFAKYELTVPVIREDRCAALLLLGSRRENRRYSTEEQALLSMLASQIAASLSRIDLLEEVVEKKVIEEELNIARTIQVNLLPAAPPRLEEYEASALSVSSKYVGGDYYDFIERNGLLAFTVADVSGKGVPASLLMASLQASFRSMMDRMEDPIAVVGRLNTVMCDITAPDKFATLFYGCLDTRKHELQYTNAGHFFPVIVREGGEVEVLDYSGLILGVQPEFTYENHRLKMHPGDTLVVTTDGVTEAENVNGDLFGEERLYPLLSALRGRSADEIKETIIERVNSFTYPRGASDDLTILILRRKV